MSNLYLIGTVHIDLEGPKKLRGLYERLKPDVILGEANQEDIFRTNQLLKGLELKLRDCDFDKVEEIMQILRQFAHGFELQTNLDYSSEKGIPFYYAGSRAPFIGRGWLEESLKELEEVCEKKKNLDFEKIAKTVRRYVKSRVSLLKHLQRWNGSILTEGFLLLYRYFGFIGEPDKYMEERLREIYTLDKVIAFPVGTAHCLDSLFSLTLYSKIKDLKPKKIPLL